MLTPNPNAIKFGVALASGGGALLAFSSPAQAEGHPVAARLFALDGVVNVFAVADFVTITKRAEADWNDLLPAVLAVLGEASAVR